MIGSNNNIRFSMIILVALYIVAIGVLLYYFQDGYAYYSTSFMERPHHIDHMNIKPGGIRGHGLGILGTLMMLALLLYTLRKRTKILGKIGTLSNWLNFHIFLGIIGPIFVVLHSSFKLNGIVAISFWSMVAVALSGVLGRYLYLQIPRTITGNELNLQDLEVTHNKMSHEIFSNFKIDETYILKIENIIIGPAASIRAHLVF